MDFRVEIIGRRLIVTQTGAGDWQDVHAAVTEIVGLSGHENAVDDLIVDLSAAAPRFLETEAEELADYFSTMLGRTVRLGMVTPKGPVGRPLIATFVNRMKALGHTARVFDRRDQAEAFLDAHGEVETASGEASAAPKSLLGALFRPGPANG